MKSYIRTIIFSAGVFFAVEAMADSALVPVPVDASKITYVSHGHTIPNSPTMHQQKTQAKPMMAGLPGAQKFLPLTTKSAFKPLPQVNRASTNVPVHSANSTSATPSISVKDLGTFADATSASISAPPTAAKKSHASTPMNSDKAQQLLSIYAANQ